MAYLIVKRRYFQVLKLDFEDSVPVERTDKMKYNY